MISEFQTISALVMTHHTRTLTIYRLRQPSNNTCRRERGCSKRNGRHRREPSGRESIVHHAGLGSKALTHASLHSTYGWWIVEVLFRRTWFAELLSRPFAGRRSAMPRD